MVNKLADQYGRERESLMPIMQAVVEKQSYLTEEAMHEIASQLHISAAQVFGTASFYFFLDTQHRGKYIIRVCKSIIAEMKGKREIIKTLENTLRIKVGQTTPDKMFSLLETNDIGWSDQEPSMLINEIPFTNLTPEKVISIINEYRSKQI